MRSIRLAGVVLGLVFALSVPNHAVAGVAPATVAPERTVAPLLIPTGAAPAPCTTPPANAKARALLVGVSNYQRPLLPQPGAVNDVAILASALGNAGVRQIERLAGEVILPQFVAVAQKLARESSCGDTLLLHFSGLPGDFVEQPERRWRGSLRLLFSDARPALAATSLPERDLTEPFASAYLPSRVVAPGLLDGVELLILFDWLRDRGVNVAVIMDTGYAARLAGPSTREATQGRWMWQPWDAVQSEQAQHARGAFFGLFAPWPTWEAALPAKDPKAKNFGVWSYMVASALVGEGARSSFRDLSVSVMKAFKEDDGAREAESKAWKDRRSPAFEASHPDRPILSVGLPGESEVRLRGRDDRRIVVTNPPLQRSATRLAGESVLLEGRVESPTRPRALDANATAGRVNPDGSFSVRLPLRRGENRVALVAWFSDVDFVPLTLTVVSDPEGAFSVPGKNYALVIANQGYRDPGFAPLQTAHGDADALAHVLASRYGFSTELPSATGAPMSLVLKDAGREQMNRALSALRKTLQPDDTLLVFFAGHGVFESQTGQAYWLPVDAARDEPSTWLSSHDVQAAIQRINARHVLVVADSCFSGAFVQRGDAGASGEAVGRPQFLTQMMLRSSRRFISSGANEPVQDGGGGGHSVFARALLDALEASDQPVTATELFSRYIQGRVGGSAKQVPQMFPMQHHDGGDLVFVPVGVKVARP